MWRSRGTSSPPGLSGATGVSAGSAASQNTCDWPRPTSLSRATRIYQAFTRHHSLVQASGTQRRTRLTKLSALAELTS